MLDNPGVILLIIGPGATFFAVIFIVMLGVSWTANLTNPQTALMVFTTPVRNSKASPDVAVTAFTSPLIALTVVIGPAIELPVLIVLLNILKQMRTRRDAADACPLVTPSKAALSVPGKRPEYWALRHLIARALRCGLGQNRLDPLQVRDFRPHIRKMPFRPVLDL